MLKMGQLHEAYTAFQRAEAEAPESQTMKLFSAISLASARRYEEAKEKAGSLVVGRLSASELVTLMDVWRRLGKDASPMLDYLSVLDDTDEKRMFLVYGNLLADNVSGAESLFQEYVKRGFGEISKRREFFMFLADLCKLDFKRSLVCEALKKSGIKGLDHDVAMEALRTWNGSKAFASLTKKEQIRFAQEGQEAFIGDEDVRAMLCGMLWKAQKKKTELESLVELAKEKNEHALLLVVEHQMENFADVKAGDLLANLKELVQLDQENMLYRKHLYDFLLQIGDVNGAGVVNRASMQVRIRQETKRIHLIEQFRRLYGMERECPACHGNGKEDCPLCMGTGCMPFIRTVAFNTSPNQVLCEHPETKYAETASDDEIHEIFDWQPMNVPSQIAGEYLVHAGAYPSDVPFPDVLVPGQTYIFLKLKESAYKRLAEEGYSIAQIDPLLSVLMSYKKMRFKMEFSQTGKEIAGKKILSASDFELEITRATTENN